MLLPKNPPAARRRVPDVVYVWFFHQVACNFPHLSAQGARGGLYTSLHTDNLYAPRLASAILVFGAIVPSLNPWSLATIRVTTTPLSGTTRSMYRSWWTRVGE